jgi:hypothetical protein
MSGEWGSVMVKKATFVVDLAPATREYSVHTGAGKTAL